MKITVFDFIKYIYYIIYLCYTYDISTIKAYSHKFYRHL